MLNFIQGQNKLLQVHLYMVLDTFISTQRKNKQFRNHDNNSSAHVFTVSE